MTEPFEASPAPTTASSSAAGAPELLRLAAGVALVATAGSLYLSEVRGFVPCPLCWLQRAMMYPLALQLLLAAWRRDLTVARHALPVAALGFVIALVQNLEAWGALPHLAYCQVRAAAPCDVAWPVWSGLGGPAALDHWLSIPVMSMLAFALVIAALWPVRRR